MPATTAAQAPVPQASVSPAPRSIHAQLDMVRSITCMKPALTRFGKRGMVLDHRAVESTARYRRQSTTCTACGLPIDTTEHPAGPAIDFQRPQRVVAFGSVRPGRLRRTAPAPVPGWARPCRP